MILVTVYRIRDIGLLIPSTHTEMRAQIPLVRREVIRGAATRHGLLDQLLEQGWVWGKRLLLLVLQVELLILRQHTSRKTKLILWRILRATPCKDSKRPMLSWCELRSHMSRGLIVVGLLVLLRNWTNKLLVSHPSFSSFMQVTLLIP